MRLAGWTMIHVIGFLLFAALQDAHAQNTCETLLDSDAYLCEFKSEDGEQLTSCLEFSSPGTSRHFDASLPAFSLSPQACQCKSRGPFADPAFNASLGFHCTGFAFTLVPFSLGTLSFEGLTWFNGALISRGELIERRGNAERGKSWVYKCRRDVSCGP